PSIKIFNIYQLDSSSNKQMIVAAYKKFREEQNQKGSDAIRLKLIKNGIYLFKESNGFGVGPGMFRYLHNEKKIPEDVGEQNGPHNWIIELLSQYGFFCLIYVFFVIFMIWKSIQFSKYHQRYSIIFILSIIGFLIMSNSPSGFGLLDINWIFTGIMILFFTNEITKTSAIENKPA
ncbi:MAG: O-antigen ligase family protein, partial [Bacteroidales bacterium]